MKLSEIKIKETDIDSYNSSAKRINAGLPKHQQLEVLYPRTHGEKKKMPELYMQFMIQIHLLPYLPNNPIRILLNIIRQNSYQMCVSSSASITFP